MAINPNKNVSLLLGMGIVYLAYGLCDAFINQMWGLINSVLIVFGTVSIAICLLRTRSILPQALKKYQIKQAAVLISFGALLLLSGFFVNYLASFSDFRIDLTKSKQHTLSEFTIDVVGQLKDQVRITAFYVDIPPRYLLDMFGEYERLSHGLITAEVIDPIDDIGYAAQFGNVISGKERKVFVKSGTTTREIDFTNKPLSEVQLTNALLQTLRKEKIAYFLAGHREFDPTDKSEKGYSQLAEFLAANNIVSKKLLLSNNQEIPDDADILIIAGPKEFLSEQEEQIVFNYMLKGGDALFLIENIIVTTPDVPLTEDQKIKNPSLNTLLIPWGIRIYDDIVVDMASHASGDVGSPATKNYMPHKAIVADLDYTFYVRPRSLSTINERPASIKVAPLLATMSDETSWGETDRTLKVKFDPGIDRPGPVPFGAVVWQPKGEAKESDTRMIVITDGDFLSNNFITAYSNAKMGLNVINWLVEEDFDIFIDQKNFDVKKVDLTSRQKRLIIVILMLMPLLIVFSGLLVWLKDR